MLIEPGTQIGEVDCPGCGTKKPLKVNSAGCVYFFCRQPVGERGGKREDCFTRFNWGRQASEKMIKEFLAQEENNAEPETREEEKPGIGHNGGPPLDDDTEPPPGTNEAGDGGSAAGHGGADGEHRNPASLGDKLKHFLTGDE